MNANVWLEQVSAAEDEDYLRRWGDQDAEIRALLERLRPRATAGVLTVREAAELLGVSKWQVRRYANAGRLAGVRGGQYDWWHFRSEDVLAFDAARHRAVGKQAVGRPKLTDEERRAHIAACQDRRKACRRGHAFTLDNAYVRPNGQRECRACMQLRRHEYKQRTAA